MDASRQNETQQPPLKQRVFSLKSMPHNNLRPPPSYLSPYLTRFDSPLSVQSTPTTITPSELHCSSDHDANSAVGTSPNTVLSVPRPSFCLPSYAHPGTSTKIPSIHLDTGRSTASLATPMHQCLRETSQAMGNAQPELPSDDHEQKQMASLSSDLQPNHFPDLQQTKIEGGNEPCQHYMCPNRARVSQAYGNFCNRHIIFAPCGFPSCRDRATEDSVMCRKHLELGQEALHEVLNARPPNVPVCKQYGCFKNDQGRGYCRGHEKLLMASGKLSSGINRRRLNSAYTMCSYPGCAKHSQRHHLCRTHGNLLMRQAEEMAKEDGTKSYDDILEQLQKDIRQCTHPNCTKNSQRDRLCTYHYLERHKHEDGGDDVIGEPAMATSVSAANTLLCRSMSEGQSHEQGRDGGYIKPPSLAPLSTQAYWLQDTRFPSPAVRAMHVGPQSTPYLHPVDIKSAGVARDPTHTAPEVSRLKAEMECSACGCRDVACSNDHLCSSCRGVNGKRLRDDRTNVETKCQRRRQEMDDGRQS